MTDARIDTGFPRHPKTKRLAKRLGVAGPWALLTLWLWATENRPSGDLSGLSAEDLEIAADWTGEEGAFVVALELVGFLDGDAGSWRLHDWERRNPWVAGAESRSEKARFNAFVKNYGRAEAERRMPEYAARLAARRAERSAENAATSSAPELGAENSASSSAPSPSPSPKSKARAPFGRSMTEPERDSFSEEGSFEPGLTEAEERLEDRAAERGVGQTEIRLGTLAGRACLRMRELGCSATNPSHPDLLAALAEGVSLDALAHAAAEAVDAGKKKPFAYAIATARSRHAEGASPINGGSTRGTESSGASSPRASAIERVLGNIARGGGTEPA